MYFWWQWFSISIGNNVTVLISFPQVDEKARCGPKIMSTVVDILPSATWYRSVDVNYSRQSKCGWGIMVLTLPFIAIAVWAFIKVAEGFQKEAGGA